MDLFSSPGGKELARRGGEMNDITNEKETQLNWGAYNQSSVCILPSYSIIIISGRRLCFEGGQTSVAVQKNGFRRRRFFCVM